MHATLVRDRVLAGIEARHADKQLEQGKPHQRLSATGKCLRQQWYGLTGAPRNDIPGGSSWEMEDGNLHEPDIVDALEWAGYEVDSTTEDGKQHTTGFRLSNGEWVSGHLDGYVRGPDLPEGWGVLEIKSMSYLAFARTVNEGLEKGDPSYWLQLQGYLETEDRDWGLLVAKAKDSSAVKRMLKAVVRAVTRSDPNPKLYAEIVFRDRRTGLRVRQRHETLAAMVASGRPPEREYSLLPDPEDKRKAAKGDWECSWCPFQKVCYPNVMTAQSWARKYYAAKGDGDGLEESGDV